MSGSGLTTPTMPECIGTFGFDCGATLALYGGGKLGFAAQLGFLPKVETAAANFFKQMVQTCTLANQYSESSFWLNYAFWTAQGYMARLTTPASPTGMTTNSALGYIVSQLNTAIKIAMPQGCTYADFVQNGGCRLEFSGLASLLHTTQMNVWANLQMCSPSLFPSITINLEGPMSTVVATPQSCTSSTSCSNGLICSNLAADPSLSAFATSDMFAPFLANSNQPGSTFQFLLNFLKGTQGVTYGTSYCWPDVQTISDGVSNWASSLVTQSSTNVYSVSYLTSPTTAFQCPVSQLQPASASSSFAPSHMATLALAVLAAFLAW